MLLKDLPPGMLREVSMFERVASGLSLFFVLVSIGLFISHPLFQKAINRMIIYASLGNILVLIGTILARNPITEVHDGNFNTALCKFQAFLIQMFLPADALWTLCMAVNIYLSMKRQWNAIELRMMEKWYFLFSYGVPFIPALIFVFIENESRGPFYGDATLWCWVAGRWDGYRIGTFYAPVWIVIIVTISIYVICGKVVRQRTKLLRDFKKDAKRITEEEKARVRSLQNNVNFVLPKPGPGLGLKMDRSTNVDYSTPTASAPVVSAPIKINGESHTGVPQGFQDNGSNHSVVITGGSKPSLLERTRKGCLPPLRIFTTGPTLATPTVPAPPSPTKKAAMKENNAMLTYFKVAFLFFLAMMVTWVPSSANRVFSVVYPGQVIPTLEQLSAFLLPLQGFFNSTIFMSCSPEAFRALWKQTRNGEMNLDGVRNIMAGFPTDSELVKKSPASKQSPFSFKLSPMLAKMSPFPAKNSPIPRPASTLVPVQPPPMIPSPAPSRKQTRDVDQWGDDMNWQQNEMADEFRPQSNDTTLAPGSPVSTGPRTSVHWGEDHEKYTREYAPVKTPAAAYVSDEDEETTLEDMLAAGPGPSTGPAHWSHYHEYYARTHDSNV